MKARYKALSTFDFWFKCMVVISMTGALAWCVMALLHEFLQ